MKLINRHQTKIQYEYKFKVVMMSERKIDSRDLINVRT